MTIREIDSLQSSKSRALLRRTILTLNQIPATTCKASKRHTPRQHSFWTTAAAALLGFGLLATAAHAAPPTLPAGEMGSPTATDLTGQQYHLKLHHLHTGESLDVVYRIGDTYLPSAMAKLNYFLRDHRTEDQSHYDPHEFDLLHNLLVRLNKPNAVVDVICGYRTPWSNNFLRTRGGTASPTVTGVAQHSQHMLAKAIDIRIQGVSTLTLRNAALSLKAGGVGYYPVSQFVHVDVGPVRTWSFGGRGDD
jgi:uncharacterized protein YcbK (DUF882 family)